MTLQKTLQALQSGKMSLEDAKKALTSGAGAESQSDLSGDRKLPAPTSKRKEAIAIVGMSGRYPDASTLTDFWDNLVQGKNAIREVPLSRFDVSHYYDPDPSAFGKISCKWLGALDEIEYFDPLFFHISPVEAEVMDPQQRLFLEEGYKALEDAGYSPGLLSNKKCGVYLGILGHEYGVLLSQQNATEMNLFGTSPAIAAARLAYLLNLKGPAIPIDTACSSSLVAMHLACQALRNQEIDMALVGGVSLCLTPSFYVGMCSAGMLSPSGQCKTFDTSADGFVPGEGAGALVLKRLADAEADHDQIYGVIIGSGINQDGATNGITAPSVNSQIDLEREIYEKYQIDPESISYVEMHGTGTKLGDPIELKALATVFQEKTQRKQYCAIGSVKSNIGHTLAAAGLVGVQKVLLAMKYKKLVPSLHFEQPNEHFDFAASPFYVNTEFQDWSSGVDIPLRAAVSSFGFSGTNAHLVIEEYIRQPEPTRSTETPSLFVLSAKSEHQLKNYAQDMKRWIQTHAELALEDIAFTLQVGRQAMDYRLAIEASSREVLLQKWGEFIDGHVSTGVHTAQVKKTSNDLAIFEADGDLEFLLHIWSQNNKISKIAQAWVRGVNIDWKLLYTVGTVSAQGTGQGSALSVPPLPYRISLPTYPFTHKRYWIPTVETRRDSGLPLSVLPTAPSAPQSSLPEDSWPVPTGQSIAEEPRTHAVQGIQARQTPALSAEALQLEEELTRSLAQVLYMERSDIDVEIPFIEMGLDSVIGIEWIQSLNRQYASNLKASSIYDYPTIRQLASFLQEELLNYRQTPVPSTSTLSQDNSLGVQLSSPLQGSAQGTIPTEQAYLASPGSTQGMIPTEQAYLAPEEHLYARDAFGVFSSSFSGRRDAIAIVGMSGKYPDASTLTDFWDNLVRGKNAIREIPLSRFDVLDYYDPNPAALGKIYCKWLGVLDGIEYFDPLFFHLSPTDALGMDPQQRLFLEEGYKAFEDAGYSPSLLSNKKCGVYLGISGHEYGMLLNQHKPSEMNLLGTSFAIAAARVAYLLNLKGPAIAIDTACSSSLVATHLACQALRHQEIDMALVGGVSLCLTPGTYIAMCTAGMLSPDGQCKTFDASGNGFVPGEGVGTVVLKRLVDAQADHDQIYGVIIGSGVNQDGATNGMTAPNVKSQIELEREIYEKYQIDPARISYVEMHGTGTKIGDPIELEALATVFQEKTQHKQYCAIGSVKTNIGHTLAAAGMAGLHKVLLAMQQKKLVPTLHFQQQNPHFDFAASPFYVNTEVQEWRSETGAPLRAAVSSFGFSGTNAHLVLEEYLPCRDRALRRPEVSPLPTSTETPTLFVLSAKSEDQLKSYAQEMKRWIQMHEELALEDIAFTLQVGRDAMDYRLAIEADSHEVLLQRLEGFIDNQAPTGVHTAQVKKGTSDATLFETDEDGQSLLHIWCQKKKLDKIAQVWVRGVNVDWTLIYTLGPGSTQGLVSTLPYRISLPTYPFARKRYLLPTSKVESVFSSTSPSPIVTAHLRSSGTLPFSIPQPIALRPLADDAAPETDEQPILVESAQGTGQGLVGMRTGLAPVRVPKAPDLSAPTQEPCMVPPPSALALPAVDPWLVPKLEEDLVRSLAQALGLEPSDINVERPFIEMGLDSITGVEWIRTLNKQYNLSLPASKVYDYPTLHAFAGFLAKEWEISGGRQHPQESTQRMDAQAPLVPEPHELELLEKPDSRIPLLAEETSKESGPETNPVVAISEIEPGIIQIAMQDRVHKNTFSAELIAELIKAFQTINESLSAKVVILTGYDTYFASGGTKESLLAIQEGKHQFTDVKIYSLALDCKLPVIAAMQGHAIGAGWSLGMFCDFIVMSRESYYASNYIKYGFTPGAGATLIFPEKLGASLAQEVLYTGKQFRGSDLEAKGVAFSVCPRKEVLPNAIQLAQELAQAPRESLMALKELLAKSIRDRVSAACERELTMHERTFVNQSEVKARIEAGFGSISTDANGQKTLQILTDQENAHQEASLVPLSIRGDDSSGPLEKRINELQDQTHQNAIAIIGMSGKYPNAKNLTDFWDNLVQGKNAIREIPLCRFDISDRYDPDPAAFGKISCKWLGALDEIEYFDSLFFHISPVEAEGMDPQHRLFLEEGYKAFEDAGYSPELLSHKKCGVYLGIIGHEYGVLLSQQNAVEKNLFGISPAIATARLAYLLNLKGPAIPIDTACSSSLVATHLACQALRLHEVDMALVGGVSLCLTPDSYVGMCNAGMLSPSGQCNTFDASADGFVLGEGVGILVLKRLVDAEADHDQIYGVIIGSGINQDGATNGITAPSVNSQIALEREIYERYQIDPESISYVEMHGTGTKLGDPIELEALSTVFQEKTQRKQHCAIGSVKTNIGHTLAVAGMAGVHKILLAMKQKKLVPSLNFRQPNEHFDFAASPFYVNTEVQDWKSEGGTPRRAAVSSFGFSGTNAHVVIEEYTPHRAADRDRRDGACPRPHPFDSPRLPETPILFVLSAKSEQQLKSYAQNMQRWLQANEELALEDIAFTLQIGREAMDYRLAILADSREVLLQRLAGFVDNHISTGVYTAQVKKNSLGTGSPGSDVALFDADEDGQSLLHTWFQKKKLEKIAQVWMKGLNVDWMLLYIGNGRQGIGDGRQGQAQPLQYGTKPKTDDRPTNVGAGFTPAFGPINDPALPHRVSLPTYPFARKRHWVPAPTATQPLTPISNPLSEIGAGAPVAKGTPMMQGTQAAAADKANQNGQASKVGTVGLVSYTNPAHTSRVVLRPVEIEHCADPVPRAKPVQPRSSITLSVSDQYLSQSSNNDDLALGRPVEQGQGTQTTDSGVMGTSPNAAQCTPVAQGTQATVLPQLEEELARSLANALCMEQDDIDVEKPFGEIGLDSVIGVEWIQSLNKQYACKMNASIVYDHPTIRQLAGFLQEELLKHGGGMQQTPVQSTPSLSLDDMLQQVQQRNLEPEKAEQLLHQLFL